MGLYSCTKKGTWLCLWVTNKSRNRLHVLHLPFIIWLPPGQGTPWQDLVSRLAPTQSFPPKAGRGLVHVRTRCWVPAPHVFEHGSQSFQSLHSPSTFKKEKLWVTLNYYIKPLKPLLDFPATFGWEKAKNYHQNNSQSKVLWIPQQQKSFFLVKTSLLPQVLIHF